MLHASTRAKTTPPAHYQQSSQMSICPLFLIFPFKNHSECCWGGHNTWQVITEESRAEASLRISSNSSLTKCWPSTRAAWGLSLWNQAEANGTVVLGELGKPQNGSPALNKGFKNSNMKSALFLAAPSRADVGSSIQPQTQQLLTCPSIRDWRLPAKFSSQSAKMQHICKARGQARADGMLN